MKVLVPVILFLVMSILADAQAQTFQCEPMDYTDSEQLVCDLVGHNHPFLASQLIEKCAHDMQVFDPQELAAFQNQFNIDSFHRHLTRQINLVPKTQTLLYLQSLALTECEDVLSVMKNPNQEQKYKNVEVNWTPREKADQTQKKETWRVSFEIGWHRVSYTPVDLTINRASDGTQMIISDVDSFDKPLFHYLKPTWKNYGSGKFLDEPQYDYALRFSKVDSRLNLTFRVSQNKQSYIGRKKKDEVVLITGTHHHQQYDHESVMLSSVFEQFEVGSGLFNIALMPDIEVFALDGNWGSFEVSLGIGPSVFFGAPRTKFVNSDGTTSFIRSPLQHMGWGVSNDIRLQYTLPNSGLGLYVATNTAYKKLSGMKIVGGTIDMEGGYQSSARAGFLIPIFKIRKRDHVQGATPGL